MSASSQPQPVPPTPDQTSGEPSTVEPNRRWQIYELPDEDQIASCGRPKDRLNYKFGTNPPR